MINLANVISCTKLGTKFNFVKFLQEICPTIKILVNKGMSVLIWGLLDTNPWIKFTIWKPAHNECVPKSLYLSVQTQWSIKDHNIVAVDIKGDKGRWSVKRKH